MKRASRIGVCAAVVAGAVVIGLGVEYGHAGAVGMSDAVPPSRPMLAVVGASISAGVGAGTPELAWPAVLAHQLGWRSMVSADPGAGYIAPGQHRLGPMIRLLDKLPLASAHPTMVIVQAGYNDIGTPPAELTDSVHKVIHQIRAQAPDAAVGVITVFPKGQASSAAQATDTTIVSAARAADPHVHVFDPLTSHWVFPTVSDHLHPTAAGHRWIADRLESDFRHEGLTR